MSNQKIVAYVAIVLVLTGCGGGGSSPGAGEPEVPVVNCGVANFSTEALARINAIRAAGANCRSAGVFAAAPPLQWNDKLALAATNHASDMGAKNYFSHTSQDGRTPGDRVNAANYEWSALAENIAAGQVGLPAVMTSWVGSDGHCANLMDPQLKDVGLACVSAAKSNTYGTYWVMDLGAP
mgnify:CR=1 FL=1